MGQPTIWWKKYKFIIEIDGVARAAFHDCTDLNITSETVKYREGGRLNPHKAPGTVEFPPITLTRGKTNDFDLYNWFKDTFDAGSGLGLDTPDLYRTFDVVQLNRKGEEVERFTVFDAYAAEYHGGSWDNDASEVGMEAIVVEPDRWERVPA